MIRVRCLYGSGKGFAGSGLGWSSSATRCNHKFYSDIAGAILRHERAGNIPTRTPKPWQGRQWYFQRLVRSSAPRFASTTPNPPPIAEVQPGHVPPPRTSNQVEDFALNPLDEATTSTVGEHIGYLKEMGLDYGWGPTAFVETLLEHVHIYLGTPWWASIGISVFLLRAGLFRFYVGATDAAARRQTIKQQEVHFKEKMDVARAEQDSRLMQQAFAERRLLYRSAGIRSWMFFAPLIQLPLGFGTFRLLRGASALPVPGFDTGGLLWIYDLTIPDPFYVLPIATTAAYLYLFKIGGETGTMEQMNPLVRNLFQYVLPIGTGIFMSFWPAAMQLAFLYTSILGLIQSILFRKPWFRNWMGITQLSFTVTPAATAPKPGSGTAYTRYQAPSSSTSPSLSSSSSSSTTRTPAKGLLGPLKDGFADVMKSANQIRDARKKRASTTSRLTDAEKRHGATYEAKKKQSLELEAAVVKRQAAQARFEREQERADREREREERLRRREEKKEARRKSL